MAKSNPENEEMMTDNDLDRLRSEYTRRRNSDIDLARYSVFNKANLFTIQQRERVLLSFLQEFNMTNLANMRILEVGCGAGAVLLEYLSYGADMGKLTGIDLLHDRLADGRRRLPSLHFACADGASLPIASGKFDLVLQYTAFSSILDPEIKRKMANEMLRVLNSRGLIIWYDFWLNPTNPQTKGVRKAEMQQLFSNCNLRLRRITLAPPIARKLVPLSWSLCVLLEKLTFLNTHYLAAIQPRTHADGI